MRIDLIDSSGKRTRLTTADIREQVRQERSEATRAKHAHRIETIERRHAGKADRTAYLQVQRELERARKEDWLRLRTPVRKLRKQPGQEGRGYQTESRRSRPRLLPGYSGAIIDSRGFRGIYYKLTYVSGRKGASAVGCAKATWRYYLRPGSYESADAGIPSVVSNMGADALEICACCNVLESVQRSARENGKLFSKIVVNLPHDISPEARLLVVHEFCESAFGAYDLPYSAVVHHPSAEGDARNTHAHIMVWWRPTVRTAPYEWSVARSLATEHDNKEMTMRHREMFAETMTWVDRAMGHGRTYTGLSHAERGLSIKPTKKIGKARTQAYRRGEQVPSVTRNAQIIRQNEAILAAEMVRKQINQVERMAGELRKLRVIYPIPSQSRSLVAQTIASRAKVPTRETPHSSAIEALPARSARGRCAHLNGATVVAALAALPPRAAVARKPWVRSALPGPLPARCNMVSMDRTLAQVDAPAAAPRPQAFEQGTQSMTTATDRKDVWSVVPGRASATPARPVLQSATLAASLPKRSTIRTSVPPVITEAANTILPRRASSSLNRPAASVVALPRRASMSAAHSMAPIRLPSRAKAATCIQERVYVPAILPARCTLPSAQHRAFVVEPLPQRARITPTVRLSTVAVALPRRSTLPAAVPPCANGRPQLLPRRCSIAPVQFLRVKNAGQWTGLQRSRRSQMPTSVIDVALDRVVSATRTNVVGPAKKSAISPLSHRATATATATAMDEFADLRILLERLRRRKTPATGIQSTLTVPATPQPASAKAQLEPPSVDLAAREPLPPELLHHLVDVALNPGWISIEDKTMRCIGGSELFASRWSAWRKEKTIVTLIVRVHRRATGGADKLPEAVGRQLDQEIERRGRENSQRSPARVTRPHLRRDDGWSR